MHVFCMPKKMLEATEARNRRWGDGFQKIPEASTSSYKSLLDFWTLLLIIYPSQLFQRQEMFGIIDWAAEDRQAIPAAKVTR